jgi:UDP:flavonoid glycosyltransferase YjiC (YdhE family)
MSVKIGAARREQPPVAFFGVPHGSHFNQTRALISAAVRQGLDVVVFTDVSLADAVRASGARFADLSQTAQSPTTRQFHIPAVT